MGGHDPNGHLHVRHLPAPTAESVRIVPDTPLGGTCMPQPTEMRAVDSSTVRAGCAPDSVEAAGCGQGLCVRNPSGDYLRRVCVYRPGDGVACPAVVGLDPITVCCTPEVID